MNEGWWILIKRKREKAIMNLLKAQWLCIKCLENQTCMNLTIPNQHMGDGKRERMEF